MHDSAITTILDLLRGESAGVATDPVEVHDPHRRVLAPGVIQVSWDPFRPGPPGKGECAGLTDWPGAATW